MSLRGRTAIAGFYELPTRRTYPGRNTFSLLAEAARGAIGDAGLRQADIDGLICSEIMPMTLAEHLRLKTRFTAAMTVQGAGPASSIATAAAAVHAGLANYVLCIFGESLSQSPHRLRATTAEWEAPFGPVVAANGDYGLIKQRYMFEFGTTQEQFAKCSVDERFNAAENENAVWAGQPIGIQDVLDSRFTNDPLHLLESVMPCSGAAAVIVTSADRARSLPNPPVYILGAGGPATSHHAIWQEDDITTSPVVMSAPTALEMAQYSVRDIEFAQFYDPYTILVMMTLEDAGICPKGEIGNFYEETDTTYKGEFPINTDGGQIGAGQPGDAGGLRHIVEAARQIMGRAGVRQVERNDLCLVNGNGGFASVMTTLVLGSSATL